jgi:hypothetical protein
VSPCGYSGLGARYAGETEGGGTENRMRHGFIDDQSSGDLAASLREWALPLAVAAAMLFAPLALVIGLLLAGLIGDSTIVPEVLEPATPPESGTPKRSL